MRKMKLHRQFSKFKSYILVGSIQTAKVPAFSFVTRFSTDEQIREYEAYRICRICAFFSSICVEWLDVTPFQMKVSNPENQGYLLGYLASFAEHLPSGNELEDFVFIKTISCSIVLAPLRFMGLKSSCINSFHPQVVDSFFEGCSYMGLASVQPQPAVEK